MTQEIEKQHRSGNLFKKLDEPIVHPSTIGPSHALYHILRVTRLVCVQATSKKEHGIWARNFLPVPQTGFQATSNHQ